MYGFDLSPLVTLFFALIFGVAGLIVAVLVGIWIDLPSWNYLASFAVPAIVGGVMFHLVMVK